MTFGAYYSHTSIISYSLNKVGGNLEIPLTEKWKKRPHDL